MEQQSLLSKALLPLVITISLFYSLSAHGHNTNFRWLLIAVFLFLTILLLDIVKRYKQSVILPINAISVTYTLVFIWQLCSIFWSPVPSDSFLFMLTSLLLPLSMYVSFRLSESQKELLLQNLTLLILMVAAFTCYQAFILKIHRPPGLFLNWNTNAAFMGMVLLPLCSQYLVKAHIVKGIIIAFLVFSMCLTVSRGALLAFSLGLGLLYVASWKYLTLRSVLIKLTIWLAIGFITSHLVLGFALNQPNVSKKIYSSLKKTTQLIKNKTTLKSNTKSNQGVLSERNFNEQKKEDNLLFNISPGRYYLWNSAWRMYLDKPILGWGFGIYHWLYPQYRSSQNAELGHLVHNDYLQFLLELGPLGLLLLLLFVMSVFIKAWQSYQKTPERDDRLIHLGYSSACISLLIHTGVTFHLYQAATLSILGLYLGLMSQKLPQIHITPKNHINCYCYYSFFGMISFFSIIVLAVLFSSFDALPKQQNRFNPQYTLMKLNNAIQRTPYLEELLSFQCTILVELLSKQSDSQSRSQRSKLLAYALTVAEQASKSNPLRASNHYNQARLLSMLTDSHQVTKQIQNAYQKALLNNPYYLEARIDYALAYFKNKEIEKGKEILNQGLGFFYSEKYKVGMRYLTLLNKYSRSNKERHYYQKKHKELDKEMKRRKRIGGNFFL